MNTNSKIQITKTKDEIHEQKRKTIETKKQLRQIFLQVGLQIEKKPLATEPDQKMAENKVTVIHKIGFKV